MSKRQLSKTYPQEDDAAIDPVSDLKAKHLNTSDNRLVLQLQSQLEMAHQELNYAAREIHDNLGHLSNLAHIHLKLLRETPSDQQQEKIDEIGALVTELNQEVKQLSINLTSAGTTNAELDQLLLKETLRLKRLGLFKLVYLEPEQWPKLSAMKRIVLFRMIQELLNNILKHSQATLVTLNITLSGSFLNILLEDNGVGYDPTHIPEDPHLGMKHLYERARIINAQLQVKSQLQEGTSVQIRTPIP